MSSVVRSDAGHLLYRYRLVLQSCISDPLFDVVLNSMTYRFSSFRFLIL